MYCISGTAGVVGQIFTSVQMTGVLGRSGTVE